jgi:SAM-dependent methyltransferase
MTNYVLDNAWQHERERLDSLTVPYDDASLAFCTAAGLRSGWRCLEVGPGTGQFALRLAEVVGAAGNVLAVDIDTRLAAPVAGPNLEVRRMDVRTEPLPQDVFDLVHARLVVEHLPDRAEVLAKLVAALKPGGWLVVEDFDNVTAFVCEPPSDVHAKVAHAMYAVMHASGFDELLGRRLLGLLNALGLCEIETQGWLDVVCGDPEVGVPQWSLLVDQLAPPMLTSGAITEADLDEFRMLLHDPSVTMYSPTLIRARGRRHETHEAEFLRATATATATVR